MSKIHVGMLLSYDYDKLKNSLPRIYERADKIFLAKDKNNLTWSGNEFHIDTDFFTWLLEFDSQNKIEIYEDNFYIPELSPIENDTRERNMLAKKMGNQNWVIQLDADEYFLNFKKFTETLKKYDSYLGANKQEVQIIAYHINLYKYDDNGVFYVTNPTRFELATNSPKYLYARKTKKRKIYTPTLILHECLAREEVDLQQKFQNWGHKDDLKEDNNFLDKWISTDINNYHEKKDLFYLNPTRWKSLNYVKGKSIHEIIDKLDINQLKPKKTEIFSKNLGQYLKFIADRFK